MQLGKLCIMHSLQYFSMPVRKIREGSFFPHGSNIYSSDIEFLVNGVSNLLSRDSAEQTNIYFYIDIHKASSLNSRGWERAAPCADGNYSTIQYFGDEA